MPNLRPEFADKFTSDFASLAPDIQKDVRACVKDVIEGLTNPPPRKSRRVHSISPKGKKPTIWSADVTANKAYKLSFSVVGQSIQFRRVGTHKTLDRVS